MSYLEALNWRYATKQMNGERVDAEALARVFESIRLAPTSYGLQAFKVLTISQGELKAKLSPACYNQPQVEQCDTLLVFAVYREGYEALVEDYAERIVAERGQTAEAVAGFKQVMLQTVGGLTAEQVQTWAAKQVYIALGFGLKACALEGLDATPMEGFNAEAVDEILGLAAQNLKSVVLLPIGKRDESKDYLVNLKKVRKSKSALFEALD